MSFPLWFRRWRALRGVPVLAADSPEGTIVQASGIARTTDANDPFVPSLAAVPCVVAWTKLFTPAVPAGRNAATIVIERLLIRPFVLETDDMDLIVDTSHVKLLFPIRMEGRAHEISIAVGSAITVIGTVLRDGVDRPTDDLAFRDTQAACKLVGNKRHPVVITASVSDTRAR